MNYTQSLVVALCGVLVGAPGVYSAGVPTPAAAPSAQLPLSAPAAVPAAPAAVAGGSSSGPSKPDRILSPEKAGKTGSWTKKRRWLKDALGVHTTVQADVVSGQKARKTFLDVFAQVDGKVNEFYKARGFAQGRLDTLLKELREDVAQEKERRIAFAKIKSEEEGMPLNYYDVQIEAVEEEAKKFEKDITQLKMDLESIGQLDKSLNERMQVLDKQIKDIAQLGTQAQELIDDIWLMIDDKKARAAFYELKGLADKVAAIKQYIEGPLLSDFRTVVDTLIKHITEIGAQIGQLERRGLIVEHRGDRLRNKQVSFLAQRVHDEAKVTLPEQDASQKRRKDTAEASGDGFFAVVVATCTTISELIARPFKALYGMIAGKTEPSVKPRKRRTVASVEEGGAIDQALPVEQAPHEQALPQQAEPVEP